MNVCFRLLTRVVEQSGCYGNRACVLVCPVLFTLYTFTFASGYGDGSTYGSSHCTSSGYVAGQRQCGCSSAAANCRRQRWECGMISSPAALTAVAVQWALDELLGELLHWRRLQGQFPAVTGSVQRPADKCGGAGTDASEDVDNKPTESYGNHFVVPSNTGIIQSFFC